MDLITSFWQQTKQGVIRAISVGHLFSSGYARLPSAHSFLVWSQVVNLGLVSVAMMEPTRVTDVMQHRQFVGELDFRASIPSFAILIVYDATSLHVYLSYPLFRS